MKRIISIWLAIGMLLGSIPVTASEGSTIAIWIDGKFVNTEVPPIVKNNRVLAPMRVVFENLGAKVTYDEKTKSIIGEHGDTLIQLTVGNRLAYVNGNPVQLEAVPILEKGRTLVPIRFIGESLGATVTWDNAQKSISILSQNPSVTIDPTVIHKLFNWDYHKKSNTLEMDIKKDDYRFFKNLKRLDTEDYSVYVTRKEDDTYMEALVQRFRAEKAMRNLSERETVNYVVSFVQSLRYQSDLETTGYDEYPKYPLETLIENGGDCEDLSILMVSLLKEMGYGVVLLRFPEHLAVGVKGNNDVEGTYYTYGGSRYYYLETTSSGWEIGQIPDGFKGKNAEILTIVPKPVIDMSVELKGNIVTATMKNEGTGAAKALSLYAAFDAGNNLVWNVVESPPITLDVGETKTVSVTLKWPLNVKTRVLAKAIDSGVILSEQQTGWMTRN